MMKDKIKAYYETHNDSLATTAKIFGANPRTVQKWAKNEGWKMGNVAITPKEKLIISAKQELLEDVEKQIKNIYSSLNDEDLSDLSKIISTELLSMASINGEMAFGLAMAKKELIVRYKADALEGKTDAFFYARDYIDMISKVRNSIYGSNINVKSQNINLDMKLEDMTDQELKLLLSEEKND